MKITIFGDICPTNDTLEKFKSGDAEGLFHDILPMMQESDLVIGNLECALTDEPKPIQKAGPVLHAPTCSIKALKSAGFHVLSLANNHIRDCGTQGVINTIDKCHSAGIKTVGAGENISQAKKPLIIDEGGCKVGIASFAEHEFNFATNDRPGAATLDVYADFDELRLLRKQVDTLIVFYHGGIEYHPYPSPLLAKKCRKMVECGADLVLCQHSHCVGTIERIGSSCIVYGQGNSLFGYRENDESWNSGMIINVNINGEEKQINHRMIQMRKDGLHFMDEDQSKKWQQVLSTRNGHINDDEFLNDQWKQFCQKGQALNLPLLLGWPRLIIALNRRLGNFFVRLLYGKKQANVTHNMLRCESHKEVIDNVLSQYDYN